MVTLAPTKSGERSPATAQPSPTARKAAVCMAGLAEYEMPRPRRTTRRIPSGSGSGAEPVLLLLSLELGEGSCVMNDPSLVGEEEQVIARLGLDTGLDAGQAGVGDRPRRQPGMQVGVVRGVLAEVGLGQLI